MRGEPLSSAGLAFTPPPPTVSDALLLKKGVDIFVIQELLDHAHIGVTASVYTHVRLHLQRQATDTLGNALNPTDDPPAAGCRQTPQKPHQKQILVGLLTTLKRKIQAAPERCHSTESTGRMVVRQARE
jgi:hypothetical protein